MKGFRKLNACGFTVSILRLGYGAKPLAELRRYAGKLTKCFRWSTERLRPFRQPGYESCHGRVRNLSFQVIALDPGYCRALKSDCCSEPIYKSRLTDAGIT